MSTVSFNGDEYSEEAFAQASRLMINQGVTPQSNVGLDTQIRTPNQLQQVLGKSYGGDRDIYEVLGYPKEPEIENYRARYERGDIGQRIINLPAQDTWKNPPEVFDEDEESDTSFTNDLETLIDEYGLWGYTRRTDKVAGIGEFGVLYIGVREQGDETDIAEVLEPDSLDGPDDIEFFTPFAHDSIEDWRLGKELDEPLDETEERYNLPVLYEIDFSEPDDEDEDTRFVHHSRLIHFPAGPRDESELKAPPRLRSVLNRLIDLDKVTGSSAEMFWAGADRKLQFDISSDNASDIPENELSKLDDEVQRLVHDMQQHIKTFNTDIEVIDGDDPDPTGIIDSILKFIAGAKGIPQRILTGSERGELASSQDKANWYGHIRTRQQTFAEPVLLRPLIDRLIALGAISEPNGGEYDVEWPNLFDLNELEQAEVERTRSEVIGNLPGLALSGEEIFNYIKSGTEPDFENAPQNPSPLPDGSSLMDMDQEADISQVDTQQPQEGDE